MGNSHSHHSASSSISSSTSSIAATSSSTLAGPGWNYMGDRSPSGSGDKDKRDIVISVTTSTEASTTTGAFTTTEPSTSTQASTLTTIAVREALVPPPGIHLSDSLSQPLSTLEAASNKSSSTRMIIPSGIRNLHSSVASYAAPSMHNWNQTSATSSTGDAVSESLPTIIHTIFSTITETVSSTITPASSPAAPAPLYSNSALSAYASQALSEGPPIDNPSQAWNSWWTSDSSSSHWTSPTPAAGANPSDSAAGNRPHSGSHILPLDQLWKHMNNQTVYAAFIVPVEVGEGYVDAAYVHTLDKLNMTMGKGDPTGDDYSSKGHPGSDPTAASSTTAPAPVAIVASPLALTTSTMSTAGKAHPHSNSRPITTPAWSTSTTHHSETQKCKAKTERITETVVVEADPHAPYTYTTSQDFTMHFTHASGSCVPDGPYPTGGLVTRTISAEALQGVPITPSVGSVRSSSSLKIDNSWTHETSWTSHPLLSIAPSASMPASSSSTVRLGGGALPSQ